MAKAKPSPAPKSERDTAERQAIALERIAAALEQLCELAKWWDTSAKGAMAIWMKNR